MKKEKYIVTGMTCSACSSRVEKAVSKLDKQRLLDTINVMMQKKKEENEARRAHGLFS